MGKGIYRRGEIYWFRTDPITGARASSGKRTLRAAEAEYRRRELLSAEDPSHAAAREEEIDALEAGVRALCATPHQKRIVTHDRRVRSIARADIATIVRRAVDPAWRAVTLRSVGATQADLCRWARQLYRDNDALGALTLGLRALCDPRCRQLLDWASAAQDLAYNMPSRHPEKLIDLGKAVERLIDLGLITEEMLAFAEDDAP